MAGPKESDRCRELDAGLRNPAKNLETLGKWLKGLTNVEDCISSGLRRASEGEDWLMLDHYVLAALYHPSHAYTKVLCEVLERRDLDVNYEDIVDVLAEIRDSASIACLKEALSWEPDWDEYRNLAVKCIWALAAIGTPDAVAAIRDAATCDALEVREAAAYELKRLGA